MGNLKQKYTDEEWIEKLQENIHKDYPTTNNINIELDELNIKELQLLKEFFQKSYLDLASYHIFIINIWMKYLQNKK